LRYDFSSVILIDLPFELVCYSDKYHPADDFIEDLLPFRLFAVDRLIGSPLFGAKSTENDYQIETRKLGIWLIDRVYDHQLQKWTSFSDWDVADLLSQGKSLHTTILLDIG
jgi:hypothetical protein